MRRGRKRIPYSEIDVVDLFCGIGGLSYGMKTKGFIIKGGFDMDETCRFAYEHNNEAPFFYRDVKEVSKKEIIPLYAERSVKILAGCAPCQPFSSYAFKNKNKDSNKYNLLYAFGRLVKDVKPDIVTMENVLAIKSFKLKNVLGDFVSTLTDLGYKISINNVFCPNYGIPQTRKRLVLLASKYGDIKLLPALITDVKEYKTVRQTISSLPPISAGEQSPIDPLHRSASLTPINIKRIHLTPEGGSWKDWPEEYILTCHKSESGRSFGSVYGRMKWDAPSPTITTQCTGFGNGRFGHPVQDRAISAREAALLQTFPLNYKFFEDEKKISLVKVSRYIGNAVPPRLGEIIAESIQQHLNEFY